ncbi:hypothetical protein N2U00_001560 [Salmonella enterica]|nr:hypothetical protein [Salmonella enterica]ECG8627219.1 hypothetical protein [Salmonella enterica subsp. diarizonae]EDW0434832.1 hypothetical protein [Salmonella enterica subsp. enterica serovar Lexington]EJV7104257.1 hypothetical protein [Salmonella enterica subsp. enterica serovar Muenchen]EAV6871668.1 hypothetical protein [Salmonella enterica]EBG1775226.1 hypothetical protein [Salmonella enterica]
MSTVIFSHPLAQATSVCEGDMEMTMDHLKEWKEEFKKHQNPVPVIFNLYGFTVGEVIKVKIEKDTLYGTLLIHGDKEVIDRMDDIFAGICPSPLSVVLGWSKYFPNTKPINRSRCRWYGC